MSIHIEASKTAVAPRVLLPGDPLRAKFIAENYLSDTRRYNEVRGMYGYTGIYKGKQISVQGTGMGMPSHAIYVHELINFYDVKTLIRIGSCGSMQPNIGLRDIILAISASTNSAIINRRFDGMNFAPTANWELITVATKHAQNLGIDIKAGNILSSDVFYDEDPESWKNWAKYGVLAVEMEAAALYTLASQFGVRALCILTVSDSLVSGEKTSAQEREKSFTQMMELALETAVEIDTSQP
ncbi:Purine nucleoside phosphorylase [Olavius algarvensis spirochete endosymbiont]|uniref:purine-nucleoside phosphorylase n=1 Tax=Olavius algarvensis spirochete endosymbiont TaxID=260710 RepID=UPI00052DE97C|nr:purine-nucleoside phosphorylase [Olavius algarvensis spirochete endosymbiont]KGM38607.1 purine nucleoside phosphorylase DeoD-type [Alkalispirochaeta odontotermitis]VDB00049.1 Purine nucleoside phosphorylase [Olavius algarvensis spirochete endosymbiont]